jgi:predicted NAD/FAD-binding protein
MRPFNSTSRRDSDTQRVAIVGAGIAGRAAAGYVRTPEQVGTQEWMACPS